MTHESGDLPGYAAREASQETGACAGINCRFTGKLPSFVYQPRFSLVGRG
ncbi:hypothetical protein SAMN02745218_01852 [Desulfofundulus australicus DSM 11792]|uniref:Uncharacterized protein n=1 Tax=Desulfofundulus australicus DSM 11792 TaxID=1121425 RepID=A0A1M5AAI0_9FIRM|nr:hypothetical protein [Desulfofundulus australicus]SHF27273.1 hypothetical protein SAMN02745218_01852 [Desulfofundulus australicus DSM 11792]